MGTRRNIRNHGTSSRRFEKASSKRREPTEPLPSPTITAWLFPLTVVSVFFLLVLRRPEMLLNPILWAEDGTIFYRDSLVSHGVSALFRLYAGYMALLPRLLTLPLADLPASTIPFLYNLLALLGQALCLGAFSLSRFRSLLHSDALRVTCCLLAASNTGAHEIFGNLCNLQWFLLIPAILLLFRGDQTPSRPGAAFLIFAGALFGLTAPVLVIAIPICVWNFRGSNFRNAAYEIGLTCALCVQLTVFAATVGTGTNATEGPFRLPEFLEAVFLTTSYRVILENIAGKVGMALIASKIGGIAVVASLTAAASWIGTLWFVSSEKGRWRVALTVYFALSAISVTLAGRNAALFFTKGEFPAHGAERYFYFPACLLIYIAALSIQHLWSQKRPLLAVALMVALFLPAIILNFKLQPIPTHEWSQNAKSIDSWRRSRNSGAPASPISVPIVPAGWTLDLP